MAAPKGNHNAAKGTRWKEALLKALAQYEKGDIKMGQALHKIAEQVVARALEGDKDAWTEIGNRLDGKPHQSMDVGHYEYEPEEMSDGELSDIARRGRNGAAKAEKGAAKSTDIH